MDSINLEAGPLQGLIRPNNKATNRALLFSCNLAFSLQRNLRAVRSLDGLSSYLVTVSSGASKMQRGRRLKIVDNSELIDVVCGRCRPLKLGTQTPYK